MTDTLKPTTDAPTPEDVRALVEAAQAMERPPTHLSFTVTRSLAPGARMRLWGRSGPWSDHQRQVHRVSPGVWQGWWSVDALAEWLDR
jgi:hypothetical protein